MHAEGKRREWRAVHVGKSKNDKMDVPEEISVLFTHIELDQILGKKKKKNLQPKRNIA